jgi:hypothetical protein
LLILREFQGSERLEFRFIEYSFSLISAVRVPHFVCGKHRYILDST